MSTVAVIGGSGGGYAMAADLTLRGHDVAFYVRDSKNHEEVLRTSEIEMTGVLGKGTAQVGLVSQDLGDVVPRADVVMVPLPSHTHRRVIRELVPHLRDGQTVVFTPGTLLSSYLAARALYAARAHIQVTFCESATLPYGTRRTAPARVNINCAVTYNPLSAFPATRTDEALTRLLPLFDRFLPAADILDAALNNQSPVTQPAGMVLNTGYIENVRDFHLHRDGVTPSVLWVEETVDAERVAVRRALGYSKPDYPMKEFYQPGSTDDRALFSNVIKDVNETEDYEEFHHPFMPYEGMNHRYLLEACGEGLVFITTLARQISVATPTMDALVQLGSVVSRCDFLKEGRTCESVGLGGLDVDGIRSLLRNGF